MPDIIAAMAPRRAREARAADAECIVTARAELVSLGGAVLLAMCLLITAVFIMAMFSPVVTGIQRFIAIVLFGSSWAYFLDSVTEKLALIGDTVVFTAAMSRTRRVPLVELEGMVLIHQGLNLEHGIETLEFRQYKKRVDRVSLGPCWQRHKLEGFLHSVEQAMQGSQKLVSVR